MVGFPREQMDGVVELDLSPPPPLSHERVSGLGRLNDELVLVLTVGARSTQRKKVPVVLATERRKGIRWGVEVSAVGAFVQASVAPSSDVGPTTTRLPEWATRKVSDGKELQVVSLPTLIDEALSGLPQAEVLR